MTDWTQFEAKLGGIPTITEPPLVKQKSRDFYWYSPILKKQLRGTSADIVVMPRSEAEVIEVIKQCFAEDIPVTLRGGGSGNYGQAMPLKGGVLLDMSLMKEILEIKPGRMRAQTGVRLLDLDKACIADSNQELRFHPSTRRIGTIGGFVAGGSGGVGGAFWGGLRDPGNILGVRVVTMEAEPKILELRGHDINKVSHAYGTNGVITEVEMPLTNAFPWMEVIIGFDEFMDATRFSQLVGESDGIMRKENAVISAPIPQKYFKQLKHLIPENKHICIMMIADTAMEAFRDLCRMRGGDILFERLADIDGSDDIPPIYEFTWNHTTLQALKVDKDVTYLQTLYPAPGNLERVEHMYKHFGEEVLQHLEFVRFDGVTTCFGLELVKFTTEERLNEIIKYFEDNGCPIFNPHAFTLEEGGMKVVDEEQLNFKKLSDPKGLMNPGKMLAWDDPDYDAGNSNAVHLFPAAGGSSK